MIGLYVTEADPSIKHTDGLQQALHVQGVEEDPVISCPLKTELVTQLSQQMRGSLQVKVGPQYAASFSSC